MIREIILPCGCHKIDELGNVYSRLKVGRVSPNNSKINLEWVKLKTTQDENLYLIALIHKKQYKVHRLVAFNFIENPKNYPLVLHKDGSRQNNQVSNLKWGNNKDNTEDSRKHGTIPFGSKHPNSKLNEFQAKDILDNIQNLSVNDLAALFNVSRATIRNIQKRKSWKHVVLN